MSVQAEILNLLAELQQKSSSYLMVTHDLGVIARQKVAVSA